VLAGKIKLSSFLVIVAVLIAGGVTGAVLTCKKSGDGDGEVTRATESTTPEPTAVAPRPTPLAPDTDPTPVDPDPTDRAEAASPSREVDTFVLGWKGKDLGASKKKDVTKGRAYKVNLYQDDGKTSVNRAKIDLDRDDKFDEKWTFDGETVSRKVAPADDENYTEESVWDGSGWVSR
jgi:hypothetical protein